MMADSVFPDGTEVARIEAATVVRGNYPDRPGFDSILPKGPVLKPAPFSIDVQGRGIRKRFAIYGNAAT